MRGASVYVGRYFGVEVRLHTLLVLLLPLIVVVDTLLGVPVGRGVGLWLLLLCAVLTREIPRVLAGACFGMPVNRLLLLPTGAAPRDDDGDAPERGERTLALVGPCANFAAGLTLALLVYSTTSSINLMARPWFSPMHLVRAAVWAQILLGGLHLLPAFPSDAGVLLRRQFRRLRGVEAGTRAAAGLSQGISLVLILLGAATLNSWALMMAMSILLTGRAYAAAALVGDASGRVPVSDAMLTQFTTLSASDTLSDALERSARSLQDVFPVARGPLLVGAISRDALQAALRSDGNGYVQSAMNRTIPVVAAEETLRASVAALKRDSGRSPLVAVVRDEGVVGILTPAILQAAGRLLPAARAGRRG